MTTGTGTPTFGGASLKTAPGTAPDVDPDLPAKASGATHTKEGRVAMAPLHRIHDPSQPMKTYKESAAVPPAAIVLGEVPLDLLTQLLGLDLTTRGGADETEIGRVIDAMHVTVDTWRH